MKKILLALVLLSTGIGILNATKKRPFDNYDNSEHPTKKIENTTNENSFNVALTNHTTVGQQEDFLANNDLEGSAFEEDPFFCCIVSSYKYTKCFFCS